MLDPIKHALPELYTLLHNATSEENRAYGEVEYWKMQKDGWRLRKAELQELINQRLAEAQSAPSIVGPNGRLTPEASAESILSWLDKHPGAAL